MFKMHAGKVVLTEAGKKIAARNAARIKAAIAAMQEMLAEVGDVEESAGMAEAGQGLAEAILLQSDNVDGKRMKIHAAIRLGYRDPANPEAYVSYVWLRDLFDAEVVYEYAGKLWRRTYAVDGSIVTLGDPVEVEVAYVDKSASLTEAIAEDFAITLEEAAIKADGTALIKVITPGWGSSGYYAREVLERDGPKAFPAGTKMYADHPTASERVERPERSIKDLAAVTTGPARWQESGADGPGLYAPAKVYEAWRPIINEMAPDIGVSIRAPGRMVQGEAEGRKGPIVEAIGVSDSIDFVTNAGRGGKLVSLSEAARNRNTGPAPAAPDSSQQEGSMLTEAETKRIADLEESVKNLTTQNQRLTEANVVREAGSVAAGILAGVRLPDVTKARLVESLALRAPVKDGALDREAFKTLVLAEAKGEAQYLAEAAGVGHIAGFGEGFDPLQEGAGEPKPEETQAALTEAFKVFGLSAESAAIAGKGRV